MGGTSGLSGDLARTRRRRLGPRFDAIKMARERGDSVVLMDTAGRLQNRAEPMAELEKIIRVMKKVDPDAPHSVLLVLDATVGQNAMSQVEIFGRVAGVTGLVMTKFDGTARGGILVAIAENFQLPIHFIGVGESAYDLEAFEARDLPAPSPEWTASGVRARFVIFCTLTWTDHERGFPAPQFVCGNQGFSPTAVARQAPRAR